MQKNIILSILLIFLFSSCTSSINYKLPDFKKTKTSSITFKDIHTKKTKVHKIIDIRDYSKDDKLKELSKNYLSKDISIIIVNSNLTIQEAKNKIKEVREKSFFSLISLKIKNFVSKKDNKNVEYSFDLLNSIENKNITPVFKKLSNEKLQYKLTKDGVFIADKKRIYKIKYMNKTFVSYKVYKNKNFIVIPFQNDLLIVDKFNKKQFYIEKQANKYYFKNSILIFKKKKQYILLDLSRGATTISYYPYIYMDKFIGVPVSLKDKLIPYLYGLYSTKGIYQEDVDGLIYPYLKGTTFIPYFSIGDKDIYKLSSPYFKNFAGIITDKTPNELKSISFIEYEGKIFISSIETDQGTFNNILNGDKLSFLTKFIRKDNKIYMNGYFNLSSCFSVPLGSFSFDDSFNGYAILGISERDNKLYRSSYSESFKNIISPNHIIFDIGYNGSIVLHKESNICITSNDEE